MAEKTKSTRGLRNNNPGNIRDSKTTYVGEVPQQEDSDPQFKQFKNIAYGYRAMFMLLSTYYNRYELKTLAGWISRWAPDNENNTKAYINEVSKRTSLNPYTEIDINNESVFEKIVAAMSFVENGVEANIVEVKVGYKLFIET